MNNCTLNWGQIFFIQLGWWPTAIFLSTWIVAYFIWEPMKKKYETERLPPPPFEELYLIEDEDKLLLNENIDKKERENNFIIENTPSGNVIMKYSIKNEGFEYWADKTISYKYLETIARKYVKTFHCVGLYIDRQEMINKKKEKLEKKRKEQEEQKKREQEEPSKTKDSLFATFKTYNKGGSKPVVDNEEYNMAAEHANKYMKRGKFKEAFKFTTQSTQTQTKLDFASFKKMFSLS